MTTSTKLARCFVNSPVGRLRMVASDEGLAGLYFPDHRRARSSEAEDMEHHPVLDLARRELAQYFAGKRTHFDTPLAPHRELGGTDFQHIVWNALLAIPFGETRSYGDIARFIGRPSAVRAVGAANSFNPISILVPCHRVVGSAGSLTGYAGGIEVKRWLLDHEAPQMSRKFPDPLVRLLQTNFSALRVSVCERNVDAAPISNGATRSGVIQQSVPIPATLPTRGKDAVRTPPCRHS